MFMYVLADNQGEYENRNMFIFTITKKHMKTYIISKITVTV